MCGAFVLAVAAAGACGGSDESLASLKSEIEVTGCLTSSGDKFVLTELDRSDTGTTIAAPSTETYTLVGDNDALRQHVGRQVRVAGVADTPAIAIVRESSPAAPDTPPVAGTTGSGAPAPAGAAPRANVATESQTRIEVSELRVRTIAPTGSECPKG
jgi:hypothetical protein